MKKIFIIGGTILFIFGLYIIVARAYSIERPLTEKNIALNNKISTNEHPTREEWLEVYTTHKIKQWTDLWKQRVAVRVAIIPKVQEIVITLTSANGQEEISQSAKNVYAHDIETIVKGLLENYDWVKNYKLIVQYT